MPAPQGPHSLSHLIARARVACEALEGPPSRAVFRALDDAAGDAMCLAAPGRDTRDAIIRTAELVGRIVEVMFAEIPWPRDPLLKDACDQTPPMHYPMADIAEPLARWGVAAFEGLLEEAPTLPVPDPSLKAMVRSRAATTAREGLVRSLLSLGQILMVGKPAEAEVALHRASFECELLDPNLCGDLDNLKPKVMSLLSQQRGPSSAAADVASCERGPSSFSSAADAAAGILAGVRLSDACAGCGATRAGGADLKSCAACGHVFYCSKSCQKADWKRGHKAACSPPPGD
mmetsp:Transcript_25804/g.81958  ORF Transcript_25804/g.81958 Transcript_25804/m.81958 type:complete len:289 (-) Transcript_25804:378-1244(-)